MTASSAPNANNLLSTSVASNSSSAASAILSPTLAADLAALSLSSASSNTANMFAHHAHHHPSKKTYDLLNKINGGLQIQYKFTRSLSAHSNKMVNIELTFVNFTKGDLSSIALVNKKLQPGMSMSELAEFELARDAPAATYQLGIDFNDTTQQAQFDVTAVLSNDPTLGGTSQSKRWPALAIVCPIGELIQPGWSISESEFNKLQAKLKGMNEVSGAIDDLTLAMFVARDYNAKLLEHMSMCQVASSQQEAVKYAAVTTSSKMQLLLSLYFAANTNKCQIIVNCEKIVLANMFVKEIKNILQSS